MVIGITGPSQGIPRAWWATRWHLRRYGVDVRRLNQAVEETGDELAVTARDKHGIIQAAEPVRVGVQWQPDYMPQRADQRRLFRHFARACGRQALW